MTHRREIGIPSIINRILGTCFNAGEALPAHVRFDVVCTPMSLINVHDVGWADINTMSATVTAGHIDECWHDILLSPVSKADHKLINNDGVVDVHYRKFRVYQQGAASCFLTRLHLILSFQKQQQA